jgi:DNA-binding MarR family transcriptional regulator
MRAPMGKKGKAKGRRRGKHGDGPSPDHGQLASRSRPEASSIPPGGADGAGELAASLVSIGVQLQRQLGHGADDDGLTRARLSALGRLVLGGPCTLGELAAREGVRPPTMTRLVHSMEAVGLVERKRHPTDGRKIVLHATAGGEALLGGGQAARLAPLTAAIAASSREQRHDLEQADAVLGRFLRELGGGRRLA